MQKYNLSPFMNTRVITSKKILYHGGYSVHLYSSWHGYVTNGISKLENKIKKYNVYTQAVNGWSNNF
jgi:hypothetical protein